MVWDQIMFASGDMQVPLGFTFLAFCSVQLSFRPPPCLAFCCLSPPFLGCSLPFLGCSLSFLHAMQMWMVLNKPDMDTCTDGHNDGQWRPQVKAPPL